MRPVLRGLALLLLAAAASPAAAQQGSVQVAGSAQMLTGDPQRLAGQSRFDPDLAVSWLQPGTRLGLFQLEIRGTRRQDRVHAGRMFAAIRDRKFRGITWSVEAGDTHFQPAIGEYKFSNLFTPSVTFNGAAVTGRSTRTTVTVVGGRTTAWRNIFGSDPQTLGQGLGLFRITHKASDRLEVSARASRIRTTDVREFSHLIAASDQAGGGGRFWLTPSLQAAADASFVRYTRVGRGVAERDVSAVAGLNWLHRRGWMQVNASRFAAGDFPTLNSPLPDRSSIFVAGDQDILPRVRAFGGFDLFRANLTPGEAAQAERTIPETAGMRQFGGVRLRLASRSTLAARVERGSRVSKPVLGGFASDSDTGSWTLEFQTAARSVNTSARYARRENVDRLQGAATFTQHDAAVQFFATIRGRGQLFGSLMATRNVFAAAGGNTYWQASGGGQFQVPGQGLWVRSEVTFARNVDLLSQQFVPRESLNTGINGQITRNLLMAVNVFVDRSQNTGLSGSPWTTRSMLRVTRMLPTGSAYLSTAAAVNEAAGGRGTASIVGSVYADWNGNGEFDDGDQLLEGIAVMMGAGHLTVTGRDGRFAFVNVPTGERQVGLDTAALPLDYDPPSLPRVDLHLQRGDTQRVSFALIPLGTVHGRVFRDANGNGQLDAADEPLDGAILVLDGGARSEQTRRGQYRFEAVRGGERRVRLLVDSLGEGAIVKGDAEVPAVLSRDRMTARVDFLVSIEKRPEIRRVFPPRGGAPTAAAEPRRPAPAAKPTGSPAPAPAKPTAAAGTARSPERSTTSAIPRRPPQGLYVVQVAAFHNIETAQDVLASLRAAGLEAYIFHPSPSDPAPYRVRIGGFASQAEAQKAAKEIGTQRGEALWVTRER